MEEDLDAALAETDPLLSTELAQIVRSPADLCSRTALEIEEELLSQSPANTATGLLSVGWATARLLFGTSVEEET